MVRRMERVRRTRRRRLAPGRGPAVRRRLDVAVSTSCSARRTSTRCASSGRAQPGRALHRARPRRRAQARRLAGPPERRELRDGARLQLQPATLDAIGAAGFTLGELERSELKKAPPLVRPLVIGSAAAPVLSRLRRGGRAHPVPQQVAAAGRPRQAVRARAGDAEDVDAVVEGRERRSPARPSPSRSPIDGAAGTPMPLPSLPWCGSRMS